MKFVRNTKTGQVLRWNKHMRNKNLVPCASPFDKATPVETAFETVGIPTQDEEQDNGLLSQEEGEAAVKELFGRDVSRVTIADMQAYAEEHGIIIPGEKPTKLQIVSYLYAARGQEG